MRVPATSGERPTVMILNSCVSGGGPGRGLTLYLQNDGAKVDGHVVLPEEGVIAHKLAPFATLHYVPEFMERILQPPYKLARAVPGLNLLGGVGALFIAARKLVNLAKQIQPDVIYCNHMLAKPVGAVVGHVLDIPVVFHARNIHDNFWIERKFYQNLARWNCVKLILCNSEASARPYAEVAPEKTHVVPNFVDLREFDPKQVEPALRNELNLPADTKVIGYLGRIVPWKGIDRLIESFAKLAPDVPEAHLVIVGENDGGLRYDLKEQLRQLADKLGVGSRTHFLGFRDDVRPYVIDFDVLALSSARPEPFGRVVIEAMALGVPPVITAHGGATEIVRDGIDGLWATPNDTADFADKLAQALTDDAARSRMADSSLKRAHETYGASKLSAEMTAMFYDIAGAPAPQGPAAQPAQ